MGRGIFESPQFGEESEKYDAKELDEYVLLPVTWALHHDAETYPFVPETPDWRVIKVDPRPSFPPSRVYFTVQSDDTCVLEELQVDVDVYGDEDSTG